MTIIGGTPAQQAAIREALTWCPPLKRELTSVTLGNWNTSGYSTISVHGFLQGVDLQLIVLHEYGHVWDAQWLTWADQQRVLDTIGRDAWRDRSLGYNAAPDEQWAGAFARHVGAGHIDVASQLAYGDNIPLGLVAELVTQYAAPIPDPAPEPPEVTMPTAADFLTKLLSQDGDQYIFGHEVDLSDTNPSAFDCSELIQWACARLGVTPTMPDGSWYQARHCRNAGTLMGISKAIATPGALLFRFSSSPFTGGRPSSAHVAVSQGNGRTIEARSSRHGVGQFSAFGRGWTHAGFVPGLSYQGDDDMAYLSEDQQKQLAHFLKVLEDIGSNPGFVAYIIPWFRKLSGLTPEQLEELEESDEIAALEARINDLADGPVTEAKVIEILESAQLQVPS